MIERSTQAKNLMKVYIVSQHTVVDLSGEGRGRDKRAIDSLAFRSFYDNLTKKKQFLTSGLSSEFVREQTGKLFFFSWFLTVGTQLQWFLSHKQTMILESWN